MASKVPVKQVEKLAEKALEKGGKALSEFERLLQKETKPLTQAAEEFADEFKRLLEKEFKPAKPQPPPPSRPQPKLTPEPAAKPAPKPEPGARVDPVPVPGQRRKKKEKEAEQLPGVVRIQDVAKICDQVEKGRGEWTEWLFDTFPLIDPEAWAYRGPGDLSTVRKDEKVKFDEVRFNQLSNEQKILELVKRARLAWKNPRWREKLKFPDTYPGTDSKKGKPYKQSDILRRGESKKAKLRKIVLLGPYGGTIELVALNEDHAVRIATKRADRDLAKMMRNAPDPNSYG